MLDNRRRFVVCKGLLHSSQCILRAKTTYDNLYTSKRPQNWVEHSCRPRHHTKPKGLLSTTPHPARYVNLSAIKFQGSSQWVDFSALYDDSSTKLWRPVRHLLVQVRGVLRVIVDDDDGPAVAIELRRHAYFWISRKT